MNSQVTIEQKYDIIVELQKLINLVKSANDDDVIVVVNALNATNAEILQNSLHGVTTFFENVQFSAKILKS